MNDGSPRFDRENSDVAVSMSTLQITALSHGPGLGGPDLPTKHYACIKDRPWPGGGTVPVLVLSLGSDYVEVWPAVPDDVEALGRKLIELANKLRKRPTG